MAVRKFARNFLVDELGLPYSAKDRIIVDKLRWSIIYEIIFEYEGKFYSTHYSGGATECQDEQPWEFEEEVECVEVEHQLVETWMWMPVEK